MKVRVLTTLLLCGTILSTTTFASNSYAEEKKSESRAVIGTDERVKVPDTTKAPYSSSAYLSMYTTSGTGTVIGKNKVLTAGHVVEGIKTNWQMSQARVVPAKDGNYSPFGSFQVESIDIHKGWSVNNNRDNDIAVVTLKPNKNGQNIGDVVPVIPVKNVPHIPLGTKGNMPGYGGDKFGEMWEGRGSIIEQSALRVYYNIDTIGGNSGGPVYNNLNELIAVHTSWYGTNSHPTKNGGSKITGTNYEFIAKHLDQKETDTQAPSQVTGVKATNVTKNSTQLSWNPSTDNVGVEKYEVYRNGARIGESKTTNYAVNGLTADTSYIFTVVAVDKAGNRSQVSSGVSIHTEKEPVIQAPSQVTGLKATNVTKNSAQLSWNPSTANVGVDRYEIYRNGTRVGESKITNYAVSGLS
ncbi:fibronectin type III domain-containing protein, partial [Enterococcus quebecensis]